jgi:hypothetical protein
VSTFLEMVTRIASDLKRTNIAIDIKNAINDAIAEGAKERFYFNEMHTSFPTVASTEYYPDLGLVEIDAAWFLTGGSRYNLDILNQLTANDLSSGNVTSGQLQELSRYGGQLRLYPIPSSVLTVYLDGYGKLTPSPLVADGDTNAWLTEGELYIRALAKRNVLRDVIRDYGEARVLEGIAEDYKAQLIQDTTLRSQTGTIQSTWF